MQVSQARMQASHEENPCFWLVHLDLVTFTTTSHVVSPLVNTPFLPPTAQGLGLIARKSKSNEHLAGLLPSLKKVSQWDTCSDTSVCGLRRPNRKLELQRFQIAAIWSCRAPSPNHFTEKSPRITLGGSTINPSWIHLTKIYVLSWETVRWGRVHAKWSYGNTRC